MEVELGCPNGTSRAGPWVPCQSGDGVKGVEAMIGRPLIIHSPLFIRFVRFVADLCFSMLSHALL